MPVVPTSPSLSDHRERTAVHSLWSEPFWSLRLLLGVVLIAGLLWGALLAVTVLPVAGKSIITGWFRMAIAWVAVLGLVLISWRFTRSHQSGARVWWLLSGGLLCYALGQSLVAWYNQVAFPDLVPVPWWSDLCFLLEYPCFFLVLALWPGLPLERPSELAQGKVVLDSLLLMGAASILLWYFLLAPFYLHSHQAPAGNATTLAYAVGDLGVLFGLVLTILRTRRANQPALLVLLLATLALLVGDIWFASLNLQDAYMPGEFPDLFWALASLLAPLAGVVQLCLTPHEVTSLRSAPSEASGRQPHQRHILLEIFRFLAPLAAALLTSLVIAGRAIIAPVLPMSPLAPSLVIFGLLLLVLIRQGLTVLEQARWRREWEEAQARALAAQASEQAMREANHQLETFLGIVSHELKTPLSSMLLSLQLLQRRHERPLHPSTGPAEKNSRLETSQGVFELTVQQLGRLRRLVNDLVESSRIQAGRLEFQVQLTDLSSLVEQVVEEYRQLAPERTLYLKQSEQRPGLVWADAERVRQVVANYVSNALKYSPGDCPVEVGLQQAGQQVRVWVRDRGPGIPQSEQTQIWERFHRVAGVEVQSGSGIGLGLGLYISKTIIAFHQGQVGVESMPGQGATFWFTLPLTAPQSAPFQGVDTEVEDVPRS